LTLKARRPEGLEDNVECRFDGGKRFGARRRIQAIVDVEKETICAKNRSPLKFGIEFQQQRRRQNHSKRTPNLPLEISCAALLSRVGEARVPCNGIEAKIRLVGNQQYARPVNDMTIIRHVDELMIRDLFSLNPLVKDWNNLLQGKRIRKKQLEADAEYFSEIRHE